MSVEVRTREQLAGEVAELRRWAEIWRRITEIFLTVDDEDMYTDVLAVVLEATESKYGVFGYVNEDGDIVCPSMTRSIWDKCRMADKTIGFPRETWSGIWGRALAEKKTLYSNAPSDVPEGHVPVLRSLAVPIIHRRQVIGLLHVANKPTDYDQSDVRLIEDIADHIAPVLNARLQRDDQERRQKEAEERSQAERDKLAQAFDAMADGVYIVDQEHNIQYVNPVLVRDFGAYEGRKCYEYFHDRNEQCPWCKNEDVWAGRTVRWEWYSARNDRTYDLIDSPLRNPDGSIWKLEIFRDITERKLAEEQLSRLRSQQAVAEEQQRRLIAADLHDRVGQTLVAAKVEAGLLRRSLASAGDLTAADKMLKLLDQTMRDVWSLTFELCPPMLYEAGLEAALEWLAKQFSERHDIACRLVCEGDTQSLRDELRGLLFHASRELLANVSKYARATDVEIRILADAESLSVCVADNGVGFDPRGAGDKVRDAGGFGLFSIRERLRHFNGKLDIDSAPTQGARITMTAPLGCVEKTGELI